MHRSTCWLRLPSSLTTWLVLTVMLVAGCQRATPPAPTTQSGEQRIVSLSPALTQMLHDLQVADQIVAVGSYGGIYDPAAELDKAIVGDLYSIDYEKLLATQPTDLLLQPSQQGIPAKLQELADRHGWRIHTYKIETVEDIARVLAGPMEDPDRQSLGAVVNREEAAQQLARQMQQTLAAIGQVTASEPRPDVLLLVYENPMTAVAGQTFLDQILTLAGGRNVLGEQSTGYLVIDREKLLTLDPDQIVIVSAEPEAANEEARTIRLAEIAGSPVARLQDPAAVLPSTSTPRVAAKLARLLHPDLAGKIDDVMQQGQEHAGQ